MLYRIGMIFTALRKWENKDTTVELYCSDADFLLALHLSELYLQHSLIMYNNLSGKDSNFVFSEAPNKRAFLKALPNKFKRAQAIELGQIFNS